MKRMLIIKACGIEGEEQECQNIKTQAEMYGITTDIYSPDTEQELDEAFRNGNKYNYIYVSAHGNESGVCNNSRNLDISWYDFAYLLCYSECMREDCILMLSCCRGGLNQVAYTLFYCCPNISYVVGPRQSLTPNDMLISFNILLYNLTHRNLDPIVACEKIKSGTDIRFICFDKLEVETETSYLMYIKKYEEMEDTGSPVLESVQVTGPGITRPSSIPMPPPSPQ